MAHSSLRFGIGRFTTEAEIDYVVDKMVSVVERLREMRYVFHITLLDPLLTSGLALCGRWSRRVSTSTPLTGLNTSRRVFMLHCRVSFNLSRSRRRGFCLDHCRVLCIMKITVNCNMITPHFSACFFYPCPTASCIAQVPPACSS